MAEHYTCARCTEDIFKLTLKGTPLCETCALVIGDPLDPKHDLCWLCGMHWHASELLVCPTCFAAEPVVGNYAN